MAKLSANARKLLELLPPDGVFLGNTKLKKISRLGKGYWKVRDELVANSYAVKGKGRGGSLARLAEKGIPSAGVKKLKGVVKKESELYGPLKDWLAEEWGKDVEPGDFFEVLVTATPRKKKKGVGQWSRPDVTVVQVNTYEYVPEPVLEVTTFEVKRFSDAQNIKSVYEAAAHSRWAHFSYLVTEVPSGDYEFPERFVSELERFNLGLIYMWKEKGEWEFDEQEWETDRLSPEPKEMNNLLTSFFLECSREKEFKKAVGKG